MPGWRHPGDAAAPAEILAGVHAEIAAKGAEEAALVAAYEQLKATGGLVPPGARGGVAARTLREERIAVYSRHRDEGMDRAGAAAKAGVSVSTAEKYETIYRRRRAG